MLIVSWLIEERENTRLVPKGLCVMRWQNIFGLRCRVPPAPRKSALVHFAYCSKHRWVKCGGSARGFCMNRRGDDLGEDVGGSAVSAEDLGIGES
jgi:hypothetical protein